MLWLAVLFALPQSSDRAAPTSVRLDEPVHGSLVKTSNARGSEAAYEFVAPVEFDVSISLSSYDFDAHFSVTKDAGARIEVEDGGIETDAWTRIHVRAGERLRVQVLASDDRPGDFELSLASRTDSPLVEERAIRAGIEHCLRAGRRARSRGEVERAVEFLERAGDRLARLGPLPEALGAYSEMEAAGAAGNLKVSVLAARALLATVQLSIGKVDEATEELACLCQATRDPALLDIHVLVLTNLGWAQFQRHWNEASIACEEEALAAAEVAGSKEMKCDALCLLANARTRCGEIENAERLLHQAIEIARRAEIPALAARVRLYCGMHYERLGLPREAYDNASRALELEPEPLVRSAALGILGNALAALHRPLEARRCFEDSMKIAHEIGLTSYAPEYLLSFANLEADFGDPDVAVSLLERARAKWSDAAHALERAEVLLSLVHARQIRQAPGDVEAGEREAQEAFDIGREFDDLRLEIGAEILLSGPSDAERPATEPVRTVLEQLASKASSSFDLESKAMALGMLAWDDCLRGRHGEAIQGANRAFEAFDALGETDQCLQALDTVALSALRSGDREDLARALERARPILDGRTSSAADPIALSISRATFATFEAYTHDLVALRLRQPGLSVANVQTLKEEGFRTAGEWKARSLVERMIRRRSRVPAAEDEGLRTSRAAHAKLRQRLEILSRDPRLHPLMESTYPKVIDARRRVEDLERAAFETASERYPDLVPRGRPPGIVRAALPDAHTALIEFVAGKETLAAYVLTRERFELVTLGDRARIEKEAHALASLIVNDSLPEDAPAGSSKGLKGIVKLGSALFAELLAEPLKRMEPGIERLVLIPTSELSSLPFEALITSAPEAAHPATGFGDLPFLVRAYAVTYAPSAPALLELAQAQRPRRKPAILIFADPAYGGAGGVEVAVAEAGAPTAELDPLRGCELERLEHTRSEAARIASLIASRTQPPRAEDAIAILEIQGDKRDHYRSVDGFELFLGKEATAERFKEIAGRFSILHIAAHGLRSTAGSADPVLALAAAPGKSGALS